MQEPSPGGSTYDWMPASFDPTNDERLISVYLIQLDVTMIPIGIYLHNVTSVGLQIMLTWRNCSHQIPLLLFTDLLSCRSIH